MAQDLMEFEDEVDQWNHPENLADYLYELRFRLARTKKIEQSGEQDFQSLYDYLELKKVISPDLFQQIMELEAEPPKSMLEHLAGFLQEHHWRTCYKMFLQVATNYTQKNEPLITHSYRIAGLIEHYIGSSPSARAKIAADLQVYPSWLEALGRGEICVPPVLRQKICDYFKVDAQEAARIQQNSAEFMQHMQQQSPQKALLKRVLGGTTCESSLVDVVESLLYPGSPFDIASLENTPNSPTTSEAFKTVLADARIPSKTLKKRYYSPEMVASIAASFGLSPSQTKLMMDTGARRSLGEILEDYVFSGGTSWPGFWKGVEKEWAAGSQTIGLAVGVSRAQLYQWMNRDPQVHKKIEAATIQRIANHTKLNDVQKDCLRALGSGDLSIGAEFSDVVHRLQRQMKALPTLAEREVFARYAFQQLLERSGQSAYAIATKIGGFEETIRNNSKGEGAFDYHWILVAKAVAKELCPYRGLELRKNTALLMLGIPEQHSPQDLLERVVSGDMTVGEMVREYRLTRMKTPADFARELGETFTADQVNLAENAPDRKPPKTFVDSLVDQMNLSGEQAKQFVAAMNGVELVPYQSAEAVLDDALAGKATFADFLEQVIRKRYQHQFDARSKQGAHYLATDLGVWPRTAAMWVKGATTMIDPQLVQKLADLSEIPATRIGDLAAIAKRRPVSYDPSLLEDATPDLVKSQRVEVMRKLLYQTGYTQDDAAEKLGVPTHIVKSQMDRGYWSTPSVPIETLAKLLIPDNYQAHRASFCEMFSRAGFIESERANHTNQLESVR